MESISTLKNERKLLKQLLSYVSNITLSQVFGWVICFVSSRASIFGVVRPFAPAIYVSVGFNGISKAMAIISMTIGNMVFSNVYETARQLLAILLFEVLSHVIHNIGKRKDSLLSRSLLIGIVIGFTGLLRGVIQGLHLIDLVSSMLCGALVFSLAVIIAPVSESFHSKKITYDSRTLFAKAVLIGIIIISLEGIVIWELEIGTVFACLAVIIMAKRKGSSIGACAGAILGMVITLYKLPSPLELPGMLAIAGAAVGLPVKTKTTSVTLWTIAVIMFSGLSILDGTLIIKYYEALLAGILFFLIPGSWINKISDELAGIRAVTSVTEACIPDKAGEAADKLFILGKALSRVSRSIEETLREDDEDGNSTVESIIEMVAEKVCNRCSMSQRCWGTQFLKTYRLVEKTISDFKTDETGRIDTPSWFRSSCTKSEKFIEALGTAYSIYKSEYLWRMKLYESRNLLAKQLAVISGSIMTAARSLLSSEDRDYKVEGMLMAVANSKGIPVSGFRYHGNNTSKPYLEAIYEARSKIDALELDNAVRENLQSTLIRVGESRRDFMGYSIVRYMRKPKYRTATGIARDSRQAGMVSGDNFAFFISNDGFHVCAISDGSGSGRRAERYSRTAIQMFENLVEDGVEISQAIRFMNLYLNLRGESERVATMDICAIDLATGQTSFYKYGASVSFIKRQNETELINLEGDECEGIPLTHYKPASLSSGDFVIMVSDGVLEAFSDQGEAFKLKWFIDELDTVNAQQLADSILNKAKEYTGSNHDDLTVLVTRLW